MAIRDGGAVNFYEYKMYIQNIKTVKLFKTGGSQAVRLPKECRFEGTDVHYHKVRPALVLLPHKGSWETLFETCREFSPGFMSQRKQLELEKRAPLRT